MKKIATVITLTAALLITGCASAPPSSPLDSAYDTLYESAPHLKGVPKELLLENALATCDVLDAGGSEYTIRRISIAEGIDATTSQALIDFAIDTLCPEWRF